MDTKDSLMDELADATDNLKAALKWWDEEARFLTEWLGDSKTGDEHNVFEEEPEWVVEGRKLLVKDKDDNPTSNPVLLVSAGTTLYITDAELLGKNPDAMVRQEPADDAKVKQLYELYKLL